MQKISDSKIELKHFDLDSPPVRKPSPVEVNLEQGSKPFTLDSPMTSEAKVENLMASMGLGKGIDGSDFLFTDQSKAQGVSKEVKQKRKLRVSEDFRRMTSRMDDLMTSLAVNQEEILEDEIPEIDLNI